MGGELKYKEGPAFKTLDELAEHMARGGYIIIASTKRRTHPRWVACWQWHSVVAAISKGELLRADLNQNYKGQRNAH